MGQAGERFPLFATNLRKFGKRLADINKMLQIKRKITLNVLSMSAHLEPIGKVGQIKSHSRWKCSANESYITRLQKKLAKGLKYEK